MCFFIMYFRKFNMYFVEFKKFILLIFACWYLYFYYFRFLVSCYRSTFLGFEPEGGPTIPSRSSWSMIRPARPKPSLN